MNKKLLCDALSLIDDAYIEESIVQRSESAVISSERDEKMKQNKYSAKLTRKMIVLGIAACLVLSAVIVVSAASPLGIRELFGSTGKELPEQAEEYIQPQSDSDQAEDWSCKITESLCDGNELVVTVEVSGGGYVLAPTDTNSWDPATYAGIDSDKTLGEYAESQNKGLLFVNAHIEENESLELGRQSIHFEYISDSQMVLLIRAEITSDEVPTRGVCTVYGRGAREGKNQLELNFSISTAPVSDAAVYVPVDPDCIYGLTVGNATVTETVMGINVQIEEFVTDYEAFERIEMSCEGISGFEGGSSEQDGKRYRRLINGQGTVTDTLVVHCYDVETGELIGDIVFERQ